LSIEGIEVLRRFLENLFEAALGYCQAGHFEGSLGGFAEGTLDRSLDQALLQFIGKRAGGQLHGLIQRMNAGSAVVAVRHPVNVNRTEDGLQGSPLEAVACVETGGGPLGDAQNGAYVPGATMLNVGLQQHSQQFTAFKLLLLFDEMKGEFQSRSRGQPGFQRREHVASLKASC